jgi:hypothetical protein
VTETNNDLSRRAFWALAVSLISIYLFIWLINFQYVYGWVMDDRLVYEKACSTAADLLAPFKADDRNALHFYFYLVSLLPAALPIELDSYAIPLFGDRTGHFRFLLLYSVFLHAILLLLWTSFAVKLCRNRTVALGSLALLVASPSLFLWTPQPDSRYFGLLAGLPGAWLMMLSALGARGNGRRQFCAGLLFSCALSIHYTSAYLLGPLAVCHWLGALSEKHRRRAVIGEFAMFALAFVIPIVGVELVSHFAAGLPWEKGPAMFAVHSGAQHTSRFSLQQNLEIWLRSAMSQMGPLLLVLILSGWTIQVVQVIRGSISPAQRTVALAIPLAVVLLLLSGKMPFFRTTTVLQPFLFLSASSAILTIVHIAFVRRMSQMAWAVALILAVGSHEARQAASVYQGHLGLGRALQFAHEHRATQQVKWLSVAWYGGTYGLFNPPDFRDAPPDSVLVTYFPAGFVWGRPASAARLRELNPQAAFPTLWSTDAVYAEVSPYWPNNDWRNDSLMNKACVFGISEFVAVDGQPLEIASLETDSEASIQCEAANVFDDGGSPDGHTSWKSASSPENHYFEIRFASRPQLDRVRIISPSMDADAVTSKIDALEILVGDGAGPLVSIWQGGKLSNLPVVEASWKKRPIQRMRLVIRRQTVDEWTSIPMAEIEEIVFPGYRPVGPRPRRAFAPLNLTDVCWGHDGVLATASGHGAHVVMCLNGKEVSTRRTDYPDQLEGVGDRRQFEAPAEIAVRLMDDFRESGLLSLQARVPRLVAVHPNETKAGQTFNVQPDGTYALAIDCAEVVRGTRLVFSGHSLKTAFGNDHWVTANLPPDQALCPGSYSIWLENPCGRSNSLEFVVRP